MKKDLLTQLGEVLKPHSQLVAAGISSERAIAILINKNLSFKPKPMSLTNAYREQLKTIATSIYVNVNALLSMLTTNQLEQSIKDHKHIRWQNPANQHLPDVRLENITCDKGVYKLGFNFYSASIEAGEYLLHDCEIQDVLAFLATVENIIDPTIARTNEFIKN